MITTTSSKADNTPHSQNQCLIPFLFSHESLLQIHVRPYTCIIPCMCAHLQTTKNPSAISLHNEFNSQARPYIENMQCTARQRQFRSKIGTIERLHCNLTKYFQAKPAKDLQKDLDANERAVERVLCLRNENNK